MFKLSMDCRSSRDKSELNRGVIFNTKMKINLREDLPLVKKTNRVNNKY